MPKEANKAALVGEVGLRTVRSRNDRAVSHPWRTHHLSYLICALPAFLASTPPARSPPSARGSSPCTPRQSLTALPGNVAAGSISDEATPSRAPVFLDVLLRQRGPTCSAPALALLSDVPVPADQVARPYTGPRC